MGFGSFAMVVRNGVGLACAMIHRPELEHVGVLGLIVIWWAPDTSKKNLRE
jgi:hypothetical protein